MLTNRELKLLIVMMCCAIACAATNSQSGRLEGMKIYDDPAAGVRCYSNYTGNMSCVKVYSVVPPEAVEFRPKANP